MKADCMILTIGLLSIFSGEIPAADLGTEFTYQGYLQDPGGPVTDTCTFRVELWDTGNLLGTRFHNLVPLEGGLFTIDLDFGPGAFNGGARELGIAVQCSGDADFTTLSPRTKITPAPYALAIPGLRTDQTGGSPNVLGGFAGNSSIQGIQGATIAGGGAAFESTDGRCALNPMVLCASNADCAPPTGPCVPDASVGRCDVDNSLCDATECNQEGTCVLPAAPNEITADFTSVGGGAGNRAGGAAALGSTASAPGTGSCSTIGGGCGNTASSASSTVGGGVSNLASARWSTVSGGGSNQAMAESSTIAGGVGNRTMGDHAAIGGGALNVATVYSTIGGGYNNDATDSQATIGGGADNRAAFYCTVGGGDDNHALSGWSTVPGGALNQAGGQYSFAAGRRAKVRDAGASLDGDGDEGTFVWADSTNANFSSTGPDQFLIRATGGVAINTNTPAASSALTVNGNISIPWGSQIRTTDTDHDGRLLLDIGWDGTVGDNVKFYSPGEGSPNLVPQMMTSDRKGVFVDPGDTNPGNLGPESLGLRFGNGSSGEGIASKRTAGGNQFGLDFYTAFSNRMTITQGGRVGIGRTPTANMLEIQGNDASKGVAGAWIANSDRRIKKNIETIGSALDALNKVRLVDFEYTDEYRAEHDSIPPRRYMNVVAQEFQEVFPEYVKSSGEKVPGTEEEILQVDTYPLTIYSAAAIQELHRIVREKDREIDYLKSKAASVEEKIAGLEAAVSKLAKEGGR